MNNSLTHFIIIATRSHSHPIIDLLMDESNISTSTNDDKKENESNHPLNSLTLSRQRAVTFEQEYRDSIQEVSKIEVFLKELLELRRKWLLRDGTAVRVDYEATKKQFDILKLKTEILSSKIDLDKLTLESYYESQQLKMLVEGTKPPDPNDEKGKMRAVKLERMMRDGADALKRSLTESILFRQNASSESKRLVNMLDMRLSEKLQRDEMINNDADNTLSLFVDRARKSLRKTEKSLKVVTGNYLVLRHNSRMATEILTKSKNDIAMQRKQLREHYQQLLLDIEKQQLEDEERLKDELEIQIRRQRSEVMKYESELELKWNENEEIREQKHKSIKEMKSAIKTYNSQYNALQERRKQELINVQGQLTRLREELSVAEEAVYSARRNRHSGGVRSPENTFNVENAEYSPAALTSMKKSGIQQNGKNKKKSKYSEFCSRETGSFDGSDDRQVLRQLQDRIYELRGNLEEL